jgi:uncharacterized protein
VKLGDFNMSQHIDRRVQELIDEAMTGFRVVIVNGPRQSGKSTLLQIVARKGGTLVTLDDREVLRASRTDPRGLLEAFESPLFIDEVQRGGDPLVLAIKAALTVRLRLRVRSCWRAHLAF